MSLQQFSTIKSLQKNHSEFIEATEKFAYKTLELSSLGKKVNFLVMYAASLSIGKSEITKGCAILAIEQGVSIDELKGVCYVVSSLIGYPNVVDALGHLDEIVKRPVTVASAGKGACMICN